MESIDFTATARRLGTLSGIGVVLLSAAYAATLAAGLSALPSPEQPIGDPFFPILEVLILLSAPLMVAVMVAVHAWTPPEAKTYSLTALIFMGLVAGSTCSVHFVILTVGRQIGLAGLPWLQLLLAYKWPSVSYAVDILAWDVFFGLSMLFAAPVFRGDRLRTSIRLLMTVSGVLALAGLSGIVVGDMQVRMIGVVGYAGVYPVVMLLLTILFQRTPPVVPTTAETSLGLGPA